jgi:lipopolysaccharide export system protein LptC
MSYKKKSHAMTRFSWDSLRAYTQFVHVSKFALSLFALFILVFMVAIPLIAKQKSGVRVAFASIEEKEDTPPIMLHPRYQGMDAKNQSYTVTADSALQTSDSTVTLEKVKADMTAEDGVWVKIWADQGLMNMTEQSLLLQGDVQLYHANETEIHTEQVRMDLKNMAAYGESSVQIQGNFGRMRANRFEILEKGNRMLFNGRISMLLLPAQ